jgi:hypothetical protein
LTHRVHIDDAPEVVPRGELAVQRGRNGGQSLGAGTSVANDIYEFRYTAKDPTIAGLASRRCAI